MVVKRGIPFLILFLIMIAIFSLCMILTYSLPNERIQAHIEENKEMLLSVNVNPFFVDYVKGGRIDEFSDLVILNIAMNKGSSNEEGIIKRAFENSKYEVESGNQYESLKQSMENNDLYNNSEYSRYWHGIQIIIRPLLLFFNYEEIRFIFMIIMFMLLTTVILIIYKNLGMLYAISFAFSMFAVCFFVVPMCIQYTGIFAITLINIIIINILHKKEMQYIYKYLFFIVGGCASFFDLLTVPLITLTIPLIIIVLLNIKDGKKKNIKESIIEIIKLSIIWGIAYVMTFLAKWIIASIVLNKNVIIESINQILFRMNGNETYPAPRLGAITKNIQFLFNNALIMFSVLIILVWIIMLIKKKKNSIEMVNIIPLLLISIYPYIWYLIFAGHSTIHAFFTYRLQVTMLFGILCMMIECNKQKMISDKRENNK